MLGQPPTTSEPLRIWEDIRKLIEEFCGLVKMVEESVSQKNNLPLLKSDLVSLPVSRTPPTDVLLEGKESAIHKASSVNEVLRILVHAQFWDFFNCELLHYMVEQYGDGRTITQMEAYMQKLVAFRKRTKISDYVECVGGTYTPVPDFGWDEFSTTSKGWDWREKSLQDVEKLKRMISQECSLYPYAAPHFKMATGGPVVLHWVGHRSLASKQNEINNVDGIDIVTMEDCGTISDIQKVMN